jgi:hypothetical protein
MEASGGVEDDCGSREMSGGRREKAQGDCRGNGKFRVCLVKLFLMSRRLVPCPQEWMDLASVVLIGSGCVHGRTLRGIPW